MADEIIEVEIRHKRATLVPPVGANYFNFSFSGSDIQMAVGYIDPHDMLVQPGTSRPAKKPPRSVDAEISHRFLLTPKGFANLRQQLQEIAASYDAMIAANRAAALERAKSEA